MGLQTVTEPVLDVLIVGGGPVGLFLGCLLAQRGLGVRVLERRERPGQHSRAIGIHPPALKAFRAVGLTAPLLSAGLPITRGLVTGEAGPLGELGFGAASADFPFILSLPQRETEAVLRRRLAELAPGSFRAGAEVLTLRQENDCVHVTVRDNGRRLELRARHVIGADGWRSAVREALGQPFPGQLYPDKYLMGDFPDTTPLGQAALVSLTGEGVVESFPLPGQNGAEPGRRWVAHTGKRLLDAPSARDLTTLIERRTGLHVPAAECRMLSAFEVRRHRVACMVRGRTVLIGDAAHVVSPIGGQGMNLGWLDAAALAPLLQQSLEGRRVDWRHFERTRLRSAAIAGHQAELNMAAGRPAGVWGQRWREQLIRRVLRSPAAEPLLARAFTMRWL